MVFAVFYGLCSFQDRVSDILAPREKICWLCRKSSSSSGHVAVLKQSSVVRTLKWTYPNLEGNLCFYCKWMRTRHSKYGDLSVAELRDMINGVAGEEAKFLGERDIEVARLSCHGGFARGVVK